MPSLMSVSRINRSARCWDSRLASILTHDVAALASAFAVYRAIKTAFSSSLISFLKPRPLGAIAKMCCEFSHVGASFLLWQRVFNLLIRQDDKMEILSPQEILESDPRLVPNWRQ